MDQRCEQDAGWNIARNTVLRFELVQIVERLGQLGIPAMSPRFGRCVDWVRAMEDIPKWLYYAANRFLLILMVRGGWSERLRATYDVLLRRSVFREPSTSLLREYRLDGHREVVWILRGVHAVKMVLFHGIIMFCHAFFVVRQAFGWR